MAAQMQGNAGSQAEDDPGRSVLIASEYALFAQVGRLDPSAYERTLCRVTDKQALGAYGEELAARLAEWSPPAERPTSGYAWLHHQHVGGADTGADLDFLKGCRGNPVGKDSH